MRLIGRSYRKQLLGAVSNEGLRALFRAIDAAIADAQQNDPV